MAEPLNPFQPPKSELDVAAPGATKRMFSPNQALGGAFLGGPFAATYILRANFKTMGKEKAARLALIVGGAFSLMLLGVFFLIPSSGPIQGLPLVYSFTTRYVVQSLQMTQTKIAATDGVTFQSNGRVIAIGLVCLVAFVVLGVAIGLTAIQFAGVE